MNHYKRTAFDPSPVLPAEPGPVYSPRVHVKNEDWINGILWLLGVATMYLLVTAIAMAMARDGLLLWDEATATVRALSALSTMMVGAVAIVHWKSGRAKKE
jgi:uncharacterized protein YaaW (UPF0174 family)